MEENQNGKNPLTHLINFQSVFHTLSLTEWKLNAHEYGLYMFLITEWIRQFQPHYLNVSVLRSKIFATIVKHDTTYTKVMNKLVRLGLLEYSRWASQYKEATVVFKHLDEEGFNVETFCEELLKRLSADKASIEIEDTTEQEQKQEQESPVSSPSPISTPTSATATEDDTLLVAHLIGKLRQKAELIGVETGKGKQYEIFAKGENLAAAHRILEKMRAKRLGEEIDIGYIENEVERIGNLAKQKLLQTAFNPFGIDLKSNVFGLTERKKKGMQVPKKQKQTSPYHKKFKTQQPI